MYCLVLLCLFPLHKNCITTDQCQFISHHKFTKYYIWREQQQNMQVWSDFVCFPNLLCSRDNIISYSLVVITKSVSLISKGNEQFVQKRNNGSKAASWTQPLEDKKTLKTPHAHAFVFNKRKNTLLLMSAKYYRLNWALSSNF